MDSERGLEASGSMCFHGVEYYVHVWVESDELHVQVEEQSVKGGADSDRWGAHFPSLYIEELTKKTGNFKRFYTFVNMLMSALQHKSESVFIDLLTYSDLELYRKRKLGKSAPSTKLPDPVAALNNKRYLILTYAVEFDRVHYPLPLNFVETPSPAMLQRTIRRLKQTLLETRTSSIDDPANKTLASMQAENASLRLRIQQLQDTREDNQDDLSSSVVHLKRQLQAATTEHKELSTLYQQLRKESAKEIQALRDQLEDHTRRSQDAPDDSQYIQRIRQLERDLDRAADEQARLTSDLKQQVTDATRELNATSTTVQELQLKNRELLRQLAIQRTKSNPQPKSKVPIDRPKDVASPSSKYTKKPRRPGSAASSDSEGNFDKKPSSTLNFKRFDPTAYHHERQQKLRARSQSPKPPTPTRKPPPRSSGGYSSDSSAGYHSGASTSTTRRSRPPRTFSSQRETDARLSSPRQSTSVSKQRDRPPAVVAATRSPRRATTTKTTAADTRRTSSPRQGRPKMSSKVAVPNLDDSDDDSDRRRMMPSFVDIDNRLNALQQFLKDAKQSTPHKSIK
ncbi:hypothetical protein, variant 2 [Aphanomyces astaci]|uniref:Uncharacterized protein n=1 Tax=Aphanomyces astaci TaxID=112090 RepID=W4HAE0_APHAT|nr:hypothetical protein, variant 2 [Aphanomyces astaci]ETV88244.1 hypothetical protein, variant 2 [Aphanomyces astaci]|eukprot:XP_009823110.1 hypothetical protein, variant 2 [Aphanomyces astaci]